MKAPSKRAALKWLYFFPLPWQAYSPANTFRTLAVVVVITVALGEEPAFRTIEMLVDKVGFQTLHLGQR